MGKDGARLRKFYSRLFGWEIAGAGGDSDYGLVTAAAGGIGGGVGTSQDGGAGHVTFFVEVDDLSAHLKKVEELGGAVVFPPTEIPEYHLTFAYFADPEGHVIGLSRGMARP